MSSTATLYPLSKNKESPDVSKITPRPIPGRGGVLTGLANGLELYRADAMMIDFVLKNPKPQYTLTGAGPHGDVVDLTYVDSLFSQRSEHHGCTYAENTSNVSTHESAKTIRKFCLEDGNGADSKSKCYNVDFVNNSIMCGTNEDGSKCISLI